MIVRTALMNLKDATYIQVSRNRALISDHSFILVVNLSQIPCLSNYNLLKILETNCSSWFEQKYERKCDNNDRCFNLNSFDPSRDCNNSVWSECHRLDDWLKFYPGVDELFHCNSGDCVPKSNVCDGFDNCKDGSDETVGCKLIPGIL